jgi:hypothetical protein
MLASGLSFLVLDADVRLVSKVSSMPMVGLWRLVVIPSSSVGWPHIASSVPSVPAADLWKFAATLFLRVAAPRLVSLTPRVLDGVLLLKFGRGVLLVV